MAGRKPSARGNVLRLLKQRGELTAQVIAEALGISQVAVRKHLVTLEAEGVVAARRVPLPRGRPTYAYQLTPAADAHFPRSYDRLAVELLADLEAIDGSDKLDRLFRARNERLSRSYATRLADKELPERIRELARLRDEEGYMAVFEVRDGTFVLREHNCPIYDVAQRHPAACDCEAELFRHVLNREVRRETTLLDGQPSCEYRIE